jgi:hypothetical protein
LHKKCTQWNRPVRGSILLPVGHVIKFHKARRLKLIPVQRTGYFSQQIRCPREDPG